MTTTGRLVRFSLVSALGIAVQLATIWIFTAAGVHYLPATLAGVSAAIVHNFAWHRRWTWAERAAGASVLVTLAAFTLANGTVSLVGNVVLMAVLVGVFGIPALGANAIAIGVCGCLNFWLGDTVVFRNATT
jgi:putative flippase GtrA